MGELVQGGHPQDDGAGERAERQPDRPIEGAVGRERADRDAAAAGYTL